MPILLIYTLSNIFSKHTSLERRCNGKFQCFFDNSQKKSNTCDTSKLIQVERDFIDRMKGCIHDVITFSIHW